MVPLLFVAGVRLPVAAAPMGASSARLRSPSTASSRPHDSSVDAAYSTLLKEDLKVWSGVERWCWVGDFLSHSDSRLFMTASLVARWFPSS